MISKTNALKFGLRIGSDSIIFLIAALSRSNSFCMLDMKIRFIYRSLILLHDSTRASMDPMNEISNLFRSLSSTVQAAQSSSISGTGGWLIAPPPHAKKNYPIFHSLISPAAIPPRPRLIVPANNSITIIPPTTPHTPLLNPVNPVNPV